MNRTEEMRTCGAREMDYVARAFVVWLDVDIRLLTVPRRLGDRKRNR